MSLENCPKCSHKLGAPLKSSGRQICMKCGWSDRPRTGSTSQASTKPQRELSKEEIRKLLDHATAQALNNMKPKGKQDPELAKDREFPFLDS